MLDPAERRAFRFFSRASHLMLSMLALLLTLACLLLGWPLPACGFAGAAISAILCGLGATRQPPADPAELRLRAAVRESPTPAMLWAEDGSILELSTSWAALIGLSPGQLEDRFGNPSRHFEFGEPSHGSGPYELDVHSKTGELRIWSFHRVPLGRLTDGRRVELRTAFDVTDHRRSQETLRQSKERLDLALAAAQMVAWEYDFVSERGVRTPNCVEIMNLPPEAGGHEFLSRVHPEDRVRVRRSFEAAMFGQEYLQEFRIVLKNGAVRWFADRANVIRAPDGTPLRLVGVSLDITDRKHAELALRESERRFRDVANHVPVHIWMEDEREHARFVNAPLAEFAGLGPEDAPPNWRQLLHPDDAEAVLMRYHESILLRCSYRAEARLRGAHGEYRWFDILALPRLEGSHFIGYVGCNIDVSERHEAEQALRESESKLQRILGKVSAAREEAERANRMKDEFLAVLSHELRTPLNAILGWAQLIERKREQEGVVREGLSAISRNAKVQAQLIEDLLDLSRIVSGKFTLQVGEMQPYPVIEEAVKVVIPAARAKGVDLIVRQEAEVSAMRADSARLQQAVWNLLNNAVKFTPSGGHIEVRTSRERDVLKITVADDGEGIDPGFLPHIFERFRQADSSTTRRFGGLGIGLAVTKQIIEQHGGTIAVASDGPGRGSLFCISLPIVSAADMTVVREQARPVGGLGDEPSLLDRIHVLVVDDEPDTLTLLARTLQSGGAKVSTAMTASEALRTLQEERPDVLLSDIAMPGEDGYELIRKVRSLSPQKGGAVRAAALTAFARTSDRQRALQAGFHMHLSKPIEPDELLSRIAELARKEEEKVGATLN